MSGLYVLFRVADANYVLSASHVLHMETYTGATPVPGAPAYVAGLTQIRRRVVPVLDLRLRFGLNAAEPSLDSRVVVVQCAERVVGLLADGAREVVRLSEDQFHPPPELIKQQAAGYVTSVAQLGPRLLMQLDIHQVIGEEVPDGK